MTTKALPIIPSNRADDLHHFEIAEKADLDQRKSIDYYICRLRQAPHPQSAQKFLDFILSEMGQRIYKKCGFLSGTH